MSLCWGDKAWTIVLQMTYHFSNSVSCTNKSADSGKHIKSFPVAFSIISQRLVYQCFNSFLLHIHLLYRVSLMRILSTSFILVINLTMKEPDWNTENSTDSSMTKNHSLGSCWFCLFWHCHPAKQNSADQPSSENVSVLAQTLIFHTSSAGPVSPHSQGYSQQHELHQGVEPAPLLLLPMDDGLLEID